MSYINLLKNSFSEAFSVAWNNEISDYIDKYRKSEQLVSGNRLRPILFYWGYAYSSESNNIPVMELAEIAVSIELIHKASIIVDDLIDRDNMRNGLVTFHRQFSSEEAIVFSNFLLNRSTSKFLSLIDDKTLIANPEYKGLLLMLNTVNEMTEGCLQELCLTDGVQNGKKVKEILDSETTSLIRNSFLLGYLCNQNSKQKNEDDIYKIGNIYGHIFQLLNDLEPFADDSKIIKHKGRLSLDSYRKNLPLTILYSLCTKKEKKKLLSYLNNENDYRQIRQLLDKYKIKSLIIDDIDMLILRAQKSIKTLGENNRLWSNEIKEYLDYLFEYCKKRI